MSEVINLGAARAGRDDDGTCWTPVEALRDLLAEIESCRLNPTMLYVAMRETDGTHSTFPFCAAGLTDLEAVGLLAQHLHFRAAP